jgi:hypothetical protein
MCHDKAHANSDGGRLVLLEGQQGNYTLSSSLNDPKVRNEIINQIWAKKMPKMPKTMNKEQFDKQMALNDQDFSVAMDGLLAIGNGFAKKE